MNQQKIGCFLKELRKNKGITQEQFAERIGVSGRTVSRWETGSNMPDISLLADIAEFYDISIPEIIDGERKGEEMKEETKEVAEKMSDYAGEEKQNIVKEMRAMSFVGLAALVIYFGLDISGLRNQGDLFANIAMYMQTLIFVTILMLPFYTTGLIYKIRRRQLAAGQPAPVRIVIGAMVALALAIIIKKGLGFLFPGL